MGLSEDAKAELREAIRIVREDKFEKYVREKMTAPPKDPPKDPLLDPDDPPKDPNPKDPDPKDPPNPPPPKDPDPDPEPPKGRRSAYWGELMD